MRIHRLEVEAFGPFAERVVVDLDAVSASGLFLVHGATGSGKTSLLDAVCFALYADVPGGRPKLGLRSDHAAPDAVPQVVLELTVAGRRLRITRSPAWARPKKRGTGTTPVQASVVLAELRAGSWRPVSTRNDEVAEEVRSVLGMGLNQFATVVLLPQGGFAAFLRASPEDRRRILERLFDISVYADVERWLADARREGANELDRARDSLQADLLRLEDALGELTTASEGDEHDDTVSLAELPVTAVPEHLERVDATVLAGLTGTLTKLDAAEVADVAAQAALAQAREVLTHRDRGVLARVREEQLTVGAAVHDQRRRALDAAERAAGVRGHLVAVRRAGAEHASCRSLVGRLRSAVATLGVDLETSPPGRLLAVVRDLDPVAEAVATEAAGACALTVSLDRAAARRGALAERLAVLTAELPSARVAAEQSAAALTRAVAQASRADDLAAAAREQEQRLTLLDDADADTDSLRDLEPAVVRARDGLAHAQRELIALQQRRLAEMAAELAAGLLDGAPCPVCGSAEHPAAATASDPVTAEALSAAEHRVVVARTALHELERNVAAVRATLVARLGHLAGATRLDVTTALSTTRAELLVAQDAVRAVHAAHEDVERLTAAAQEAAAECDRAAAGVDALDERLAELTVEAGEAQGRLAEALTAHEQCPCTAAGPAGHARVARALTDLVRATDDLQTAADREDAATEDLGAALAEAGFDDAVAADTALLTTADLDRMRDAVQAHERDLAAARAVLEESVVATSLASDPPDVEALIDTTRSSRRALLEASTAHGSLGRAARTLQRLRPALDARCRDVAERFQQQAVVRELADTVGGTGAENTLRMPLTSFVLAARLEKVAALANERLGSGLGLRVLDQWTGRSRDTSSLSGGESFMASLALALGLADAVREEAGGLDLGTLFIDEGFGSLDDESLEQVLSVLDGLRDGGRAVGVVSHVADLRARIPAQVVVTKGAAGSTVAVRAHAAEPAA